MFQCDGRDRQDGDAVLVDEEGILIGAVGAAAILDDLQSAGGYLFSGPVIQ